MSGAVVSADELASFAAAHPPTEGLLTPFGWIDVPALSEAGRVHALVALERLRSWVDAEQARVFAACAAAEDAAEARDELGKQWAREEICAALRVSRVTVDDRIHVGTELVTRLPKMLALLETARSPRDTSPRWLTRSPRWTMRSPQRSRRGCWRGRGSRRRPGSAARCAAP